MNEAIPLWAFLHDASLVTKGYIKLWGEWTPEEQNKKIAEEIQEFLSAPTPLNEIEEFWDVFFSTLTKLHLKKYDDLTILMGGLKCMGKIQMRLRQKEKEVLKA